MHLIRALPVVFWIVLFSSSIHAQPAGGLSPSEFSQERFSVFQTDTSGIQKLIRTAQEKQFTQPETAALLLDKALHMSRLADYHDGAAWALFALGGLSVNRGDYAASRGHFRQAYIHCLNALYDKELLPMFYNNMGMSYTFQGNYALAVYYYYMASGENKADDARSSCLSVLIYSNLAGILTDFKQYDQALYYLEKGETTGYRYQCWRSLAYLFNNKGNLLLDHNHYDSAWSCYRKSLELGEKINDIPVQQAALANLGHVWLIREKPEAAIPYLERAMALNDRANPYYARIEPLFLLGNAYAQMKKFTQAEQILRTAIKKADALSAKGNLVHAHANLAGIYEIKGRYREALAEQKIYARLRDSMLNKEKTEAINRLEVKYRTAEKDRELTEKQLLIARQQTYLNRKNFWITGISAGSLLLTVSLVFLYRSNRQKQRLQEERILNLEQQQKIAVLQAMVNGEEKERSRIGRELHDGIGGMLSAVKMNFSIIQSIHPEAAEGEVFRRVFHLLDETAAEVRKTAHNLMPEMLFRHGLAEALAIFCESVSHRNGLQIDFQAYGNLEALGDEMKLTVYRTVQELVQNILKHAGATETLVQLSRHGDLLGISVEDNGAGFDMAQTSAGMGLQNLKSRVTALNGDFSLVSETGSGTKAYIEFNLQQWTPHKTQ